MSIWELIGVYAPKGAQIESYLTPVIYLIFPRHDELLGYCKSSTTF